MSLPVTSRRGTIVNRGEPRGVLAAIWVTATLVAIAHAADAAGSPSAADTSPSSDLHGASPCAACHGARGEGNAVAGFPRLAGLPAAYLAAQLDAMAKGTRQSTVMGPRARVLSAKERLQWAAYYAAERPAHAGGAPAAHTATSASRLALRGRWSDEIPACVQCHGEQGSGVGSRFPPLAGQPAVYLANQLRAWQQGTRRGDPAGLMQAIARRLSAEDIQSVSGYFALQPTTVGAGTGAAQPRAGGASSPLPPASTGTGGSMPRATGATLPYQATFTPADRPIPDDAFGQVVQLGREIFDDPARYASRYVGNDLRCTNCHLDEGRRAGSAPMWAAYVSYPAYRAKNHHVNTFAERLQGCFRYSMNGRIPPLGDPVLVALESYAYWMALGARLDPDIAGRGYPKPAPPALPPDYRRGARVYARSCALCHGADGQGQRDRDGNPAFPALWGADSFNWGAGMGSVTTAAAFIEANMPLSRGGMLRNQEAWDVALFMDSQERPQDPRYAGSVADTRKRFHAGDGSMYGTMVNGHLLGSDSVAAPPSEPLPPISW